MKLQFRQVLPLLATASAGLIVLLALAPRGGRRTALDAVPAGSPDAQSAADADAHGAPDARERNEACSSIPLGHYRAAVGSRFEYRFSTTGGVTEGEEGALARDRLFAADQVEIFSGALDHFVADRRGDEILVRVGFQDLSFELREGGRRLDHSPRAACGLALASAPTWVRLGSDGSVRGYLFPEGFTGRQRNRVRAVVGMFAFAAPVEHDSRWSTIQGDVTGVFEASYEGRALEHCAGVAVRRLKNDYSEVSHDRRAIVERSVQMDASAHLCSELGWIRGAEVRRCTVVEVLGLGLELGFALEARLAFAGAGKGPDMDPAQLLSIWAASWQPAAGHLEDESEDRHAMQEESWAARLASVTIGDLLASGIQFAAEKDLQPSIAIAWLDAIAWKLRLEPGALKEVERAILDRAREGREVLFLLQALAWTDTESSQQALARLYSDRSTGNVLLDAATAAMFELPRPRPEILAAVAADVDELGSLNAWSERSEQSLLLFGTLASRSAGPLPDGRDATDLLLGIEADSLATGKADAWLRALGNCGDPAVESHALRYVTHPTESVREAAVTALRKLDSASTRMALLEVATKDSSEHIRKSAIEVLGMNAGPVGQSELADIARRACSAEIREAALSALAFDLRAANQGRDVFDDAVRSDPDERVRARARELLAPAGDPGPGSLPR